MPRRRLAPIWLLAATWIAGCGPPAPTPHRIVLVSMDTVRADRVEIAAPGSDAATGRTPHLSAIANEGFAFRRAYAMSNYTLPSHMSLFTGLDPAAHGVHRLHARLHPDTPTLAGLLRDAGFRTQAFHEGGFVSARYGFDAGFDAYEKLPAPLVTRPSLARVLGWMRDAGEARYFLFLHTYTAHFPYGGYERHRRAHPERDLPTTEALRRLDASLTGPPDPAQGRVCTLYNQLAERRSERLRCGENRPGEAFRAHPHFASDLAAIERGYDARVRRIDEVVGRVRGLLEDLGQWEDTLLVVTSDHGDAFYEHGLYRHAFVPFDEVMRVPLLISYPRLARTARATGPIDGLVSHLDVLPTLLGLAGVDAPTRGEGIDLTDVLLGRAALPADRAVFPAALRAAQLPQVPLRRIVVRDELKLIEGHPEFGDATGLLFDLDADPGELRNLRETEPERYDALTELARAYSAALETKPAFDQRTGLPVRPEPAGLETLDPEAREQLRALGYGD